MKKTFTLIVLIFNALLLVGQTVTVSGDAAIFNQESIALTATVSPAMTGTWYWATTDKDLDLSGQHNNVLNVTPSDTGVFLYRAIFFDGIFAYYQDFKLTVAPCGSNLIVKDYELQQYENKRYGSICWMAENLRSTRYSDGSVIPVALAYNDNESNVETYGRLYDYASALRGATGDLVQGVCPDGWQLPKEEHLNALVSHNGNAYDYESGDWLKNKDNNSEGFNLMPAGFYNANTLRYENLYGEAYLILNSPLLSSNTYRVGGCSFGCPSWLISNQSALNGYSARCVRTHPQIDVTRPSEDKLYTVQFLRNGGMTAPMAPQTGIGGTTLTLATNTFAHDGNWEFAGWNTKADGTGTDFTDGQSFPLTQDTILYAQWHTWCTGTARYTESGNGRVDSVADYEGNQYQVVQIGKQCWLKENMRATKYADGVNVTDNTAENSLYAHVMNDINNDKAYGLVYNYPAAARRNDSIASSKISGVRGICPNGWHVPSVDEWYNLASASNVGVNSGTGLAKLTGGDWSGNSQEGSYPNNYSYMERNTTGFSAYPVGYYNDGYHNWGRTIHFWTVSPSKDKRYRLFFENDKQFLNVGADWKRYYFSIRCVRDTIDTLTFLPNGATGGSMLPQKIQRGVPSAIKANAFTHDGNWAFTGWNTKADGTGTAYADLAKITLKGNDTLYAQWHTWCTGTAKTNELGTSRIDSVKDHQNNWYQVVQIGNQCWMKENMRCTTSPSTETTIFENPANSYSYSGKKAYNVNGNAGNTATYGLLYNWCAAVDTFNTAKGETSTSTDINDVPSVTFSGNRRGICPTGWHVPSDAEWTQMTDYVSSQSACQCGGSSTYIAKALAYAEGWNSYSGTCVVGDNQSSNNTTGFSAIPAGYYTSDGYVGFGDYAGFWSATEGNSSNAYGRALGYGFADVYRSDGNGVYGCSVRCVRDIFVCGTSTLTDYDNNTYNTVKIGNQCWMKENLKTTHYSDGTAISQGSSDSYYVSYWYYPCDNASTKSTYGLLYNWKAVMGNSGSSSTNPSGVQGICPIGWHVPSDAEWTQLIDYVSGQSQYCCSSNTSYVAKALASPAGWVSSTVACAVGNTPSSNNATGFSAVPAGFYTNESSTANFGFESVLWSATESNRINAYCSGLYHSTATVYRNAYCGKNFGYSVRCLKD